LRAGETLMSEGIDEDQEAKQFDLPMLRFRVGHAAGAFLTRSSNDRRETG
jgi:hypothetical protein